MRKSGRPAGRHGSDFQRILIRRPVGHFLANPPIRFLGLPRPRFGRFRPRKPNPARDLVLGPNAPKAGPILGGRPNGQEMARFFRKFAKMRNFAKSCEKKLHFRKRRKKITGRNGQIRRFSAHFCFWVPKSQKSSVPQNLVRESGRPAGMESTSKGF